MRCLWSITVGHFPCDILLLKTIRVGTFEGKIVEMYEYNQQFIIKEIQTLIIWSTNLTRSAKFPYKDWIKYGIGPRKEKDQVVRVRWGIY